MFATILGRVDELKATNDEIRNTVKASHDTLTVWLKEHDAKLVALELEDEVGRRQTKWAVATAAVVGWAINTFINWKH